MPAIGDWAHPWDPQHDEAFLVLLGMLRGGAVAPGDPVDLVAVATGSDLSLSTVRGAASRVLDLGMLRLRPDRRAVWAPLSDADWAAGFDHYVRLGTCAMRLTAPVVDEPLRALYRRRTATVRRQAALRTEQFGVDFAFLTTFWDVRCPDPTVQHAMLVAFDRLRYGRYPTSPWSVWDSESFLAPALAAAESGDATLAVEARHAFYDLVPLHLRTLGLARPDAPITTARDAADDQDDRTPDGTFVALLAAVRSGRLAPGSVHTTDALARVVDPGVPVGATQLLPALRRLRQIGVVTAEDGAVRIAEPDLEAWAGSVRLLGGLVEVAAVEVLPLLDGAALQTVRGAVQRARLADRLREPSYRTAALAVVRVLAAHSRSRWTRDDVHTVLDRLTYTLPEPPAFRQWDAEHVWSALDAAAGAGDVALARTAAGAVVGLLDRHLEDAHRGSARMDG